ncbi:MAG: porin [Polyangiaceae bacterium]|nr:porin [Polyangiaceae bacterium]
MMLPVPRRLPILAAVALFASPALAHETAPEPLPAPRPWTEAIALSAFVDAYGSVNYGFPKPQGAVNAYRAYDATNGFSLHWVGLDAAYDPDPVGGQLSLRFGPGAVTYAGAAERDAGLEMVKQAYASWRPVESLTLDLGKFDTPVGAEVADSQANANYTRGVVYWLAQPLFHTGLRATWEASESLTLKLLAVNGWNATVDNNIGKTFGAQLVLAPAESLTVALGWIGGPEEADTVTVSCSADTAYDPSTGACGPSPGTPAGDHLVDQGGANDPESWRHLGDVVVTWQPVESFTLSLNGDYGVVRQRTPGPSGTEVRSRDYWGAALAARYQLDDTWAVAGRGEYYDDVGGATTGTAGLTLATGTLTLEARPTANLVLRLEQRADHAVDDAGTDPFAEKVRDSGDLQLTTTLGVVVTTN